MPGTRFLDRENEALENFEDRYVAKKGISETSWYLSFILMFFFGEVDTSPSNQNLW